MPLTDAEKIDRISGIHAWDTGCRSSGIYDPDFKAELRGNLDEAERLLKLYVVDLMSRSEYGFEDLAGVVSWAARELGLEY